MKYILLSLLIVGCGQKQPPTVTNYGILCSMSTGTLFSSGLHGKQCAVLAWALDRKFITIEWEEGKNKGADYIDSLYLVTQRMEMKCQLTDEYYNLSRTMNSYKLSLGNPDKDGIYRDFEFIRPVMYMDSTLYGEPVSIGVPPATDRE